MSSLSVPAKSFPPRGSTVWLHSSFHVVWTVTLNNSTQMTFWDLGGEKDFQKIWKQYLAKCHFVVFVIDAHDRGRLPEAKEALGKFCVLYGSVCAGERGFIQQADDRAAEQMCMRVWMIYRI